MPISDLPNRVSAALRVEPSRNGQKKRVRSAQRYEIARIPVTLALPP